MRYRSARFGVVLMVLVISLGALGGCGYKTDLEMPADPDQQESRTNP